MLNVEPRGAADLIKADGFLLKDDVMTLLRVHCDKRSGGGRGAKVC